MIKDIALVWVRIVGLPSNQKAHTPSRAHHVGMRRSLTKIIGELCDSMDVWSPDPAGLTNPMLGAI